MIEIHMPVITLKKYEKTSATSTEEHEHIRQIALETMDTLVRTGFYSCFFQCQSYAAKTLEIALRFGFRGFGISFSKSPGGTRHAFSTSLSHVAPIIISSDSEDCYLIDYVGTRTLNEQQKVQPHDDTIIIHLINSRTSSISAVAKALSMDYVSSIGLEERDGKSFRADSPVQNDKLFAVRLNCHKPIEMPNISTTDWRDDFLSSTDRVVSNILDYIRTKVAGTPNFEDVEPSSPTTWKTHRQKLPSGFMGNLFALSRADDAYATYYRLKDLQNRLRIHSDPSHNVAIKEEIGAFIADQIMIGMQFSFHKDTIFEKIRADMLACLIWQLRFDPPDVSDEAEYTTMFNKLKTSNFPQMRNTDGSTSLCLTDGLLAPKIIDGLMTKSMKRAIVQRTPGGMGRTERMIFLYQ